MLPHFSETDYSEVTVTDQTRDEIWPTGKNNCDNKLKRGMYFSAFELLKPFDVFWDITVKFWTDGYPKEVHNFLGPIFNELAILSGM